MERDSFIFYNSFYQAISELPESDRLAVYDAIAQYSLSGEMPELSGVGKAIMTLIRPQIDANQRRYENGRKGAEHGNKGGRPRKNDAGQNPEETPKEENENPEITPKKPQENPNETPNVNDNVKENSSPDGDEQKKEIPPSSPSSGTGIIPAREYPVEELARYAYGEKIWVQAMMINHRIRSEGDLKKRLQEFIPHCISRDEAKKTLRDFKQHFDSYLRKKQS